MTPDLSASRKAVNQRRYRARLSRGIQMLKVEIDQDAVESLLARGLLRLDDVGDETKLRKAVEKAARGSGRMR